MDRDARTILRVFHKRKSFEHEREFRAVICEPIPSGVYNCADGPGFVSSTGVPGIYVEVDPAQLVERIYVAPGLPLWFRDAVTTVAEIAGLGQPDQSAAADQAALVSAAEHFLRVFDNLEFEPFEAAWSSSRSVFFPFRDTPERVEGAAVGERFRQFFAEVRSTRPGPPYLHLEPRELRAEVIGDAGLVTFMLGRAPGEVSRRTAFFLRERGEWKLRHLHASNIPAAEAPK